MLKFLTLCALLGGFLGPAAAFAGCQLDVTFKNNTGHKITVMVAKNSPDKYNARMRINGGGWRYLLPHYGDKFSLNPGKSRRLNVSADLGCNLKRQFRTYHICEVPGKQLLPKYWPAAGNNATAFYQRGKVRFTLTYVPSDC